MPPGEGVDWLGLSGSIALIVPPLRMEARKLRIFFEERKVNDPAALRPLRRDLIDAMKRSRDAWNSLDSLFLLLGGLLLSASFLTSP